MAIKTDIFNMGAFLEKTLSVAGSILANRKTNALLIAEGGGYGSFKLVGGCTNELQNVLLQAAKDNAEIGALVCFTYAQLVLQFPEMEIITNNTIEEMRAKRNEE